MWDRAAGARCALGAGEGPLGRPNAEVIGPRVSSVTHGPLAETRDPKVKAGPAGIDQAGDGLLARVKQLPLADFEVDDFGLRLVTPGAATCGLTEFTKGAVDGMAIKVAGAGKWQKKKRGSANAITHARRVRALARGRGLHGDASSRACAPSIASRGARRAPRSVRVVCSTSMHVRSFSGAVTTLALAVMTASCGTSAGEVPADEHDSTTALPEAGGDGANAEVDALSDAGDDAAASDVGGDDGASSEAEVDALSDAGGDADVSADANADEGTDAAQDARIDALSDAGADVATDAGSDAALDTRPEAGGEAGTGDAGCVTAANCPPNQACNAGSCGVACSTVHPCNGGCCAGGTCVAGTAASQCGNGGDACVSCPAGGTGNLCLAAVGGGTCGCNSVVDCNLQLACSDAHVCTTGCDVGHPCRGGCCAGTSCVLGSSNFSCGSNGGMCASCVGTSTPNCTIVGGARGCH